VRVDRLRRGPDIVHVHRRGSSYSGPLLRLKLVRRPPEEPGSRVAIIVGSNVGKAVRRNRVRRRLREIIRIQGRRLRAAVDVVVIARPEAAQAKFRSLEAAVRQLLRKARLLEDGDRDSE
jgi:ribonuclease P protein component